MTGRIFVGTAVAVAATLVSSVCHGAAEETKTAQEIVAKEYLSLWLAGRTGEGLAKHWDVNRCFINLFGNDYSTLPLSDRLHLQHVFKTFLGVVNRSPKLLASLKGARIKLARSEQRPQNHTRISAGLTTTGGTRQVFVDLVRVDGSWKIVNIGHGGKGLEALIPVWKLQKAGAGKSGLGMVEWWEMMLSGVLSAKYPDPGGGDRQAAPAARRPGQNVPPPAVQKKLAGYWAVQRVTVDGRDDDGNDGSYLILRANGAFRVVAKGTKPTGMWQVTADNTLVLRGADGVIMRGIWRRHGNRLTLSFDVIGAQIKITYLRANLDKDPKAPDGSNKRMRQPPDGAGDP